MKSSLDLMMRVGTQVDTTGKLEVFARLVEHFIAKENFANEVSRIVARGLGIERRAGFYKAALGDVLCEQQKGDSELHDVDDDNEWRN